MNENERIINLLTQLGNKLGQTGEQLFKILVIGKRTEGFIDLGVGVVWLLILGALLYLGRKCIKYANNSNNYISEDAFDLAGGLAFGFSILAFVFSFAYFHSGFLEISAPEYIAVKELLSILKK